LEAQRNQAFNQVAQMQVLLDDNAAEIKSLTDQIEEAKPAMKKAAK